MLLLVAATEPELCGHDGLVCGVGPVEAAAATARELAQRPPAAVLHVGIAGGRGLAPCSVVVGTRAVYCDLHARIPVMSAIEPAPVLVAAAQAALPEASSGAIGTTAGVGTAPLELTVEAMEGFAVLRAAALAGVPAVEVRIVSNEIGEPDRARWRVAEALETLATALPRLVAAIDLASLTHDGPAA